MIIHGTRDTTCDYEGNAVRTYTHWEPRPLPDYVRSKAWSIWQSPSHTAALRGGILWRLPEGRRILLAVPDARPPFRVRAHHISMGPTEASRPGAASEPVRRVTPDRVGSPALTHTGASIPALPAARPPPVHSGASSRLARARRLPAPSRHPHSQRVSRRRMVGGGRRYNATSRRERALAAREAVYFAL